MLVFDQLKKGDRQLWAVTLMVCLGMCVLITGLWYLQVVSTRKYAESLKNQSSRKIRFPALRGKILDRNGVVLAENRPCFNINLYLEELSGAFQKAFSQAKEAVRLSSPEGKRKLSKTELDVLGRGTRYQVVSNIVFQLGNLVQQPLYLDANAFLRHYTNRLALPMPVLENVAPEKIAIFMEQPHRLPGLNLDVQPLRTYLHGTLASHVLGHLRRTEKIVEELADNQEIDYDYCLPDFQGEIGVECAFDTELRGSAGAKAILVNHLGYRQSEQIWSEAEPGYNVVLTIDARIQKAAEEALHQAAADAKGAVVVMDCQSGDILAMASAPAFDPNVFIPRVSTDEWTKLSDPDRNPTLNRATYGSFAPGSIFKIVVALAALEAGDIDPQEMYHSLGYYQLGRRRIADTAGPGEFNLRRALLRSSNSYFINFGLKTGLTNIMNMGHRFFLGSRTHIPLRQEVAGQFPSPEWLDKIADQGAPFRPGDLANLCIGQGYITVTPLQMAIMTAAVANGGKVLWPRLVDRLAATEGEIEKAPVKVFAKGIVRGELGVRPRHLELVRAAMLADVEDREGTGRTVAIPGYRISGKTGTAQVLKNGSLHHYNTWFVSFAPYENPQYAVAILVEEGVSGTATCVPVAKKVYQAILQTEANPAVQPVEKPLLRPVKPDRPRGRAEGAPTGFLAGHQTQPIPP